VFAPSNWRRAVASVLPSRLSMKSGLSLMV
jgi:hypothetical protein